MNPCNFSYRGQIETVLHYINTMLHENWTCRSTEEFNQLLSITELAKIAGMSARNLQLMFKVYMRETLHQYIIRIRMERAQQILKEERMSITEISDYIGLANQSALNNIFQKKYHLTPQEKQMELSKTVQFYPFSVSSPNIVEITAIPVIYLSYIGSYDTCNNAAYEMDSWDRLYNYALQNDLIPSEEDYWGIAYDDRYITSPDKCRFYACMSIKKNINFNPSLTSSIKLMNLPGGAYAVYTHQGSYTLLDAFYDTILKQLPQNYYLGESPILEHYLNSPIDTDVKSLLTEVWIPIAPKRKI